MSRDQLMEDMNDALEEEEFDPDVLTEARKHLRMIELLLEIPSDFREEYRRHYWNKAKEVQTLERRAKNV